MKCYECNKELNEAEVNYNTENAKYCCDGFMCGCMGQPIEPPYCFECISNGLIAWQNKLNKENFKSNKVYKIANNAIYFNDNSDYLSALYEICRIIMPHLNDDEFEIHGKDFIG